MAGTVVFSLILYFVFFVAEAEENVVRTDAGTFVGQIDHKVAHDSKIRSVKRFLGIPFAKPPTGDRRFMKPEVPDDSGEAYNATYHRPHCPQLEGDNPSVRLFGMDEDCLYLNIYVPGKTASDPEGYPVMIWIHGGAFRFGGADVYSADVLSSFNDVIVVTFHYRLNVFGFLSEGNDMQGNYGLWDQKMAIEWVHTNIEKFGGDAKRVTIFGESAGAASVIYHALNPDNKGLFQRIIAQSGAPLAQWAFQKTPKNTFQDFARRAKCNNPSSHKTFDCLRNLSVQKLLSNINLLDDFSPSIDGDFLKMSPTSIFEGSSNDAKAALEMFRSFDYLSGVNSKDGATIVTKIWAKHMKLLGIHLDIGVPMSFFENLYVPKLLQATFGGQGDDNLVVTKAVLHLYTDWSDPNNTQTIRSYMIDVASDIFFFVPAIKTALQHAKSGKKTYFYEFDHKPWIINQRPWLHGAEHAMEIPYVFGLPESLKVLVGMPKDAPLYKPGDESELASKVMALWTNFAKTGNPTSPGVDGVPAWPAYDSASQTYLHITKNMTSHPVKRRLVARRFAFWQEVVPSLRSCSSGSCQECPVSASIKVVALGSMHFCPILMILSYYSGAFPVDPGAYL